MSRYTRRLSLCFAEKGFYTSLSIDSQTLLKSTPASSAAPDSSMLAALHCAARVTAFLPQVQHARICLTICTHIWEACQPGIQWLHGGIPMAVFKHS